MSSCTLVGDIGGTSARFGIVREGQQARNVSEKVKLDSDKYDLFDAALEAYLEACPEKPKDVLLAVAGPIEGEEVQLTNRDWHISASALKAHFGFQSVTLVNDFVAMARAVPELGDDGFEDVLSGEAEANAPILVAGPGTGLGMATLLPNSGGRWRVLGGEGGHSTFAPRSREDVGLADILKAKHGFVSYELVTSGRGLEPVHKAMCQLYGRDYEPMSAPDMLAAAAEGDDVCEGVCAVRARAVMGFAGDMMLANGARGGVVLAGGVTARLLPWLQREEAQSYFLERGPRSDYMASIPVRSMQGEFVPLMGAAALSFDRSGG